MSSSEQSSERPLRAEPDPKVRICIDCSKMKVGKQKITWRLSQRVKMIAIMTAIRKQFDMGPEESLVLSHKSTQLKVEDSVGVIFERFNEDGVLFLDVLTYEAWGFN